ncbi:hypothetical protein FRC01_013583 [Tulasnella sp. 417]|nr:hypothetical protein FRC01_013583 [Tulasnella sp. 417]
MATDASSSFGASSITTSSLSEYQLYTFTEGDVEGPVVDLLGKPVYFLSTVRNERGILESTTITRSSASGSLVAQIRWAQDKVTIGPSKSTLPIKNLLQRKIGVPSSKYHFQDENKSAFYWKEERCMTPEKQLIAQYARQKKGPFSVLPEQPATLLVAESYAISTSVDYILTTAVIMEMRRKQAERSSGQSSGFGGGIMSQS